MGHANTRSDRRQPAASLPPTEREKVLARGREIMRKLPRLGSVTYHDGFGVAVQWRSGLRAGVSEIVDLAPDILSYKSYRPLREDRKLFKTVHLINNGTAIAWGSDDNIAMAATTVERLAEETTMDASDFRAWRKRHHLTNEAVAAHLGISRRLVGYYASERQVPKYITLACRYLDLRAIIDELPARGAGAVARAKRRPP